MRNDIAFWASLTSFANLESTRTFPYLRFVHSIWVLNDILSSSKLVVVGDQSSGKSSLLEGLTGLSFPVASDLCTRFATQIVLRRAPASEAEVRITIIPGPDAQGDENTLDTLLGFEKTLSAEEFDSKRFQEIFDEVCIYHVTQ
jgi:hypothetical protein